MSGAASAPRLRSNALRLHLVGQSVNGWILPDARSVEANPRGPDVRLEEGCLELSQQRLGPGQKSEMAFIAVKVDTVANGSVESRRATSHTKADRASVRLVRQRPHRRSYKAQRLRMEHPRDDREVENPVRIRPQGPRGRVPQMRVDLFGHQKSPFAGTGCDRREGVKS